MRHLAPITAWLLAAGAADAADLTKVDRTIAREPAYRTKAPRYALLVIGPEARDRAWLVKDGDDLHVLADKPVKLSPKKPRPGADGREYELAELTINGKTHHNLRVDVQPVKRWLIPDLVKHPGLLAVVKRDPDAPTMTLALDVVAPHLKAKGTVGILAGPVDLDGPLLLAVKPADAPVVHLAGPLAVTFYMTRPQLKRERSPDASTAVGTAGLGAGTFAMVVYQDTIPESAHPRMEVTFAVPKAGDPPVKKVYELKQRC